MKLFLFLLLTPLFGTLAAPVISEIVASNDSGLKDEDGEHTDWIELYNPESTAFDLDGHFLSDSPDDPEKWTFPDVTIPGNGYLVIFATGKDRTNPEANLHTGFKLSSGGESVVLTTPEGETLSSVIFPPLAADHSYVRLEDEYAISNSPTPGEANATNVVLFSLKGQAFTDSLILELTSPGSAPIRYTVDGKGPTLFNGRDYMGPITIDETMLIAAIAGGGPLTTEVFIKVDPELAERTSDIPLVIADASSGLNQTTLKDMAFAVIEPSTDGRARLVSEFSLGSRGGIRTRGETSNSFPKKPLRIEFWDGNGDDRDLSPLGMPAESDWVLNARYSFDRTLMHNAWIYELSNELGQWAPRTRFVEVYLNDDDDPVSESDYQGIYTFLETIDRGGDRVDVERMESSVSEEPGVTGGYIFKKDKTDPGTWNFSGGGEGLQMTYPPEEEKADRGAQAAWLTAHLNGVAAAIRDNGSDPETGYPSVINVNAWLDHHMLNFLTNNVDALRLSAYFHKPRSGKLVAGPIWDFDRSAGGPSDGRIANPLQWGDGGGGTAFFERGNHGTPVWWENLFENSDFTQEWVDRWYALRTSVMVTPTWDPEATPLPAFSDANIARIIDHMAAEIMEAQERNFAKWTSAGPRSAGQLSYSDGGGFEGEIEHIKGWLKARAEWVEEQLIYLPHFEPTEPVHNGPVSVKIKTGGTLFKPALAYYTTDGSDPRFPGGDTNPDATPVGGSVTLNESGRLSARRVDDTYEPDRWGPDLHWSGLGSQYYFVDTVPADTSNLVVSEIMYHPANPTAAETAAGYTDDDDFEYVELLNISNDRVDLSEARLDGSMSYRFPDRTILEPGERLVLARNPAAFAARYGNAVVTGTYDGQLGNGGDTITVLGYEGTPIREFSYMDNSPWPDMADGDGKALVLKSPATNPDPAQASQWTTGNGTPGAPEPGEGGGGDSPYDIWLAATFSEAERGDSAISGPEADPDGDGLPTLAEYLVGGDPFRAEPGKTPVLSYNNATLEIRYETAADASGVDVKVETSDDLRQWSEVTSVVETVGQTVTHSVDSPATMKFVRLKLTKS